MSTCSSNILAVDYENAIAAGNFIKNNVPIDFVDLEVFGKIFEKEKDTLSQYWKQIREQRRRKKQARRQNIQNLQARRQQYIYLLIFNFLATLLLFSYLRFKRID
ncbi:MAG: hypothetical protein AAFU64_08825 [Bacteroidota bacterium]